VRHSAPQRAVGAEVLIDLAVAAIEMLNSAPDMRPEWSTSLVSVDCQRSLHEQASVPGSPSTQVAYGSRTVTHNRVGLSVRGGSHVDGTVVRSFARPSLRRWCAHWRPLRLDGSIHRKEAPAGAPSLGLGAVRTACCAA
jgi:hypothetical protein